MKIKTTIVAALFAAVLAGCTSEAEEAPLTQTVNALCPQLHDPVTEDGGTVEWRGLTIGFCCPKCSGKFEALDDAGKIAALAEVDVTVGG